MTLAQKIIAMLFCGLLIALIAFDLGYKEGVKKAEYEAYMEKEAPETEASR